MLHRAQLYTTTEVEPWTVGASIMDTTFKLDSALNLDCDWIVDTAKVFDTQWMWSNELKTFFLPLTNSLCCWILILSKKCLKKFSFYLWNLKWEKLLPPHVFHILLSLIPKLISIQISNGVCNNNYSFKYIIKY